MTKAASATMVPAAPGTSVVRSVGSNIAGDAVNGIVAFVLTPILIGGLGDYQYGMWALVYSVLSSYGLLDAGMRISFQRFVARCRTSEESGARNQILAATMVLIALGAVTICGLTAVLVLMLPAFFHIAPASRLVFRGVLGMLGLSVAVALPTRAFGSLLTGLQRFDYYNLGAVVTLTCRAVLLVLAVHIGWGLLGMAAVTLAVELTSVPFHWYLVRKADPLISLDWGCARWARMRELAGFSFYAYLSSIGDYLRFYTDSAVIGRMLGLALVTPFSAASRIIAMFKGVITSLASPLMPRMSELDAHHRSDDLRDLFLRSTRFTALACLFIASLVFLDGKALLRLWLGERFTSSYSLLLVLAAGSAAAFAQAPSLALMFAKGRHRMQGWWTMGEGIANVLLSVYWAPKWGVIGVALGTAVPMLITALFIQPAYVVRLAGISMWDYMRDAWARPLLASALFVLIARLIFSGPTNAGVAPFALSVGCQATLFAPLAYFAGFNSRDRRLVRDRSLEVLVRCGKAVRSLAGT